MHFGGVVALDDVDEMPLGTLHHRQLRDDDGVRTRRAENVHVDEHAGAQAALRVGDGGAYQHGAGIGIVRGVGKVDLPAMRMN